MLAVCRWCLSPGKMPAGPTAKMAVLRQTRACKSSVLQRSPASLSRLKRMPKPDQVLRIQRHDVSDGEKKGDGEKSAETTRAPDRPDKRERKLDHPERKKEQRINSEADHRSAAFHGRSFPQMFLRFEEESSKNSSRLGNDADGDVKDGKENQNRRQNGELDQLRQIREWKWHRFHLADDVFNRTQVWIRWNPRNGKGGCAMRTICIDAAVLRACFHRPAAIDAFKANCVLGKRAPDRIKRRTRLFLPGEAIGRRLMNRGIV